MSVAKDLIVKTEHQAIEWLRTKFDSQGYAIFPQVADGTGFRRVRTADAIMMSLWPSRGLDLYGIEYKRTAADWKRELNAPDKAESIARYCDYWYILAPRGLIDPNEVPAAWGLWEIDKRDRLLRTVKARANKHKKDLDTVFFASLIRSAQKTISNSTTLQEIRRERYRLGFDDGKKDAAKDIKNANKEHARLTESVAEFEKASGITISRWYGATDLGGEVRAALALLSDPRQYVNRANQIKYLASNVQKAATVLADKLTESLE